MHDNMPESDEYREFEEDRKANPVLDTALDIVEDKFSSRKWILVRNALRFIVGSMILTLVLGTLVLKAWSAPSDTLIEFWKFTINSHWAAASTLYGLYVTGNVATKFSTNGK